MAKKISLEDALGPDEDTSPATSAPGASIHPISDGRRGAKTSRKTGSTTTRLTIDFDVELHRALKSFALLKADDASLAAIVRAAIAVLTEPKSRKETADQYTVRQQFAAAVLTRAEADRRAQ
jgi:hypothetical protein